MNREEINGIFKKVSPYFYFLSLVGAKIPTEITISTLTGNVIFEKVAPGSPEQTVIDNAIRNMQNDSNVTSIEQHHETSLGEPRILVANLKYAVTWTNSQLSVITCLNGLPHSHTENAGFLTHEEYSMTSDHERTTENMLLFLFFDIEQHAAIQFTQHEKPIASFRPIEKAIQKHFQGNAVILEQEKVSIGTLGMMLMQKNDYEMLISAPGNPHIELSQRYNFFMPQECNPEQ